MATMSGYPDEYMRRDIEEKMRYMQEQYLRQGQMMGMATQQRAIAKPEEVKEEKPKFNKTILLLED